MNCLYVADVDPAQYPQWKKEDSLFHMLKECCGDGDISILAKDLAHEDPAHVLASCILDGKYDLVVGTGFAGVFALIIGRAMKSRTVLVNPMYPAKHYLPNEYPDYEYEELLSSFEFDKLCWDSKRESLDNVFVILSEDDDIVDTKCTDKYFVKGNAAHVTGGHYPAGDDFKMIFRELVRDDWDRPEDMRKRLEAFKETGSFDVAVEAKPQSEGTFQRDSDSKEANVILLPGNERIVIEAKAGFSLSDDNEDWDEDEDEENDVIDSVVVTKVSTRNGNIAITWTLEGEPAEHVLYLYYKDGSWYRDEEGGRERKTAYLEAVLQKAAPRFLMHTKMAEHDGSDYWGWVW